MDWHSWLSRSTLGPSLTYEYGLAFTRNKLEKEDLVCFNHEFLKSLGIHVAKHRLEILKLVRKDLAGSQNGLSRLFLAINKTRKLLAGKVGKWGFHSKNSTHSQMTPLEMRAYPTQWSGWLRRFSNSKDDKPEKPLITTNNIMKSGPLDRRVQQEKMLMTPNRCLSISGPLDGKLQDKWMLANWSPMRSAGAKGRDRFALEIRNPNISTPWEGRGLSPSLNHYCERKVGCVDDGGPSLWSLMFQDLKPT